MAKSTPSTHKKEKKTKSNVTWVLTLFPLTFAISAIFSFASNWLMARSTTLVAFFILLLIVLIGIIFDIIGVAVTSAQEQPFHAMAAKKVPGGAEAIRLLRKADRVGSVCNDVIGDICGVISGAASATIAGNVLMNFAFTSEEVLKLALSALVAGLTVGGKALGKGFAIRSSTTIVSAVGKLIYYVKHFPSFLFQKKKRQK